MNPKVRDVLKKFHPRDVMDKVLHPARRRRALRAISRTPVCGSILFVCYGNICRSPYAAASFAAQLRRSASRSNQAMGDGFVGPGRLSPFSVTISSAGFVGPGRQPPEFALSSASRRNLDLSNHTSRIVSVELVRSAEWIVVMDAAQRRALARRFGVPRSRVIVLGDLDPVRSDKREIEDPWNKPEAIFERSYQRIDRCVREFVGALQSVVSASKQTPQRSNEFVDDLVVR